MNKNKFFEKVGKLTFSILLTGALVTGVVIAAANFTNGDVLDATDLNNAIDEKVSFSSIPNCGTGESLTYDGSKFSCFSPADIVMPEAVQAGMEYNYTFEDKTVSVTFPTPFSNTPNVVIAMNGFYLENSSRTEKFELYPTFWNVTPTGFKLKIPGSTHDKHKLKAASVTWIAIPPNGTWSSPTTSTYTGECGDKKITNNEKNGSCLVGVTNTYYSGEESCTIRSDGSDREDDRDDREDDRDEDGYEYSSEKHQTCN